MADKKQPYLKDILTMLGLGLNPKTGLPYKLGSSVASKEEIKKALRVIDEQDAVNRYKWYNLPLDLSSQELERLLYYKGQLIFFYSKELNQFFFTSFALDGYIDIIGRYIKVKPIAINGSAQEEKDNKRNVLLDNYLSTLRLNVKYGIVLDEDLTAEDLTNSCVVLRDYTNQLAQQNIPRQTLNDPIIDIEAECLPMMRTNLIASSGVKGMRVADADQSQDVLEANEQIRAGALTGNVNIPIVGTVEFQELASQSGAKTAEFMLAMQSIDNFRLSTYGLENGGLFEKKQHMLESENSVNQSSVKPKLQDGLSLRQNFCNIVNSIWDLGIWCEVSENETMDINGDGVQYDENETGESSGVSGGVDNANNEV